MLEKGKRLVLNQKLLVTACDRTQVETRVSECIFSLTPHTLAWALAHYSQDIWDKSTKALELIKNLFCLPGHSFRIKSPTENLWAKLYKALVFAMQPVGLNPNLLAFKASELLLSTWNGHQINDKWGQNDHIWHEQKRWSSGWGCTDLQASCRTGTVSYCDLLMDK